MGFEIRTQVNFSRDVCLQAACAAVQNLDGVTIDRIDRVTYTIYLQGNISLFSWGEYVEIQMTSTYNGLTEIVVESTPKIGMWGVLSDMGKNKRNLNAILRAISNELIQGHYPQLGE